jgi:hypothetical protein
MTNFNTDYNTTELLDQELTIEQLEGVAGGLADPELQDAYKWVLKFVMNPTGDNPVIQAW